jgi:uncharacterized protein YndB with AHSA1/START domain
MSNFIITKSITIKATPAAVWKALTDPEIVKQYMFGSKVISDWQKGSLLTYKGVWEGKPFEDKGTILEIEPEKILKATYYSALSGLEDKPENYSTVTYEMTTEDGGTKLTVTQDNLTSQERADHTAQNWEMVLGTIKQLLEK